MSLDDATRTLASDFPLTRAAERYRLTVTAGGQVGAVYEGAAEPARVGSREGNSLRLASETVSRYHFEIVSTAHGFLLRDLDSTNGTFVDGYRVREIWLGRHATIRAGEATLRFDALGEDVAVELTAETRFGDALGRSPAMRELFTLLERVAQRDLTVLIEGESGTGKERLAEALHARSPRAAKKFVVFDCGAVPAALMESELFGHERGAFTGAESRRIGRFEEADGGTLFLDEIGELPLELQPKLLRALERREVRRVGGSQTLAVDARVVAATNRDLAREVNRGAFREDLYYRLAVVRVRVPPLRDRRDDIPLLVEHFVRDFFEGDLPAAERALAAVTSESWEGLRQHAWPGNVRELRNFIERTLAISGAVDDAPDQGAPLEPRAGAELGLQVDLRRPFFEARDDLLAHFERAYLEGMLTQHGGNIARAARAAGMDRMHFKRLLARRR